MYKTSIMSLKLKRLSIKNFKCFATQKTFDFSKLTILTGGNSSGKSSILHAILGAVQSGEFPFKFSPNGKYVNMGDFKEISNQHLSKDIFLSYTFKHKNLKSDYTFDTIWKSDNKNFLPELKFLKLSSAHTHLELKKNKVGYLLGFSYDPNKDPDYDKEKQDATVKRLLSSSLRAATLEIATNKKKQERELAKREKFIRTAFQKKSIRNFQIKKLENILEEVEKKANMNLTYTVDALLRLMWVQYGNVINLISSFRNHPDRTYLEQSKDKLKVDKFGEGYLDQIILWEKNKSSEFKELQKLLKDDFSLLTSLNVNRKVGGGRYEILVKIKDTGTETSLFDVGFGLNQFIPIIVADLQLKDGSTLFVAEPEIHLHPDVQAKFGDYLVRQIDNKKKNYVIETHSEYFLNRIRMAIVKGTLKEENLSVYYLENGGDDTKIHKLKFTKSGSIEGAPDSFFETYLMDLREIALNAE